MTRIQLNNLIWTATLLLQLFLLIQLFRRKVARELPVFALLVAFYPLRAAATRLLFGHVGRPAYIEVYSLFSVIDLFLQFALVVEIARRYAIARGGWTMPRLGVLAGILAGSALSTFALVQLVPPNTPLPPDRAQIFNSFLVILLCVWMMARPASRLLRQVSLGFAFFGVLNVLSIMQRTVAASHRDIRVFTTWAYVGSLAFVVVLIYWLIALRGETGKQAQVATG